MPNLGPSLSSPLSPGSWGGGGGGASRAHLRLRSPAELGAPGKASEVGQPGEGRREKGFLFGDYSGF